MCHFCRSYLKTNKVSKNEEKQKVEYTYHLMLSTKNYQISPHLLKLQLAKVGMFFFETLCILGYIKNSIIHNDLPLQYCDINTQ